MPHKKNPDVFELIRGKCNRMQAVPNELTLLMGNLPSGYHRDLQLTKEILFPALGELKECLDMTGLMVSNMRVQPAILEDDKYRYIFSVEAVNDLVKKGVPFRDAYRQVARDIAQGTFTPPAPHVATQSVHEGSIGRLSNQEIVREMHKVLSRF